MRRLSSWRRTISRPFILIWRTIASAATFLFKGLPIFLYGLVFQELIWRWWLGYGERAGRVLGVVVLILIVTSVLYWQFGTFDLDPRPVVVESGSPSWDAAFYYSRISFSALGYGSWAPEPLGWAKWLGAVQPFIGIISAVALSINLTQRISR